MATEEIEFPGHLLPDKDWAAVVRRAEEIAREAAAQPLGGGASPIAGPILDWRYRSNKHSGPSRPTQLLVLHSAECPLLPGYAQSLTEWAITSDVVASWQRFVGPDVRVYMIPDNLQAWHASEANPMSIGWEQAGYARYSRAEWTTPLGLIQLDSLAYDMAMVALEHGIPAVWLTTSQVTAVTTFGDTQTKGFCAHRQIDPETRTDPGDNYPYDLLMERIRAFMGSDPEEIDMSAEANIQERLTQIVGWMDARFNTIEAQATSDRDALAGWVRDLFLSDENVSEKELDAKLSKVLSNRLQSAGVPLYKGKDSADVYIHDSTGFRHIGLDEYLSLRTSGAYLLELDQNVMDQLLKAVAG